jgi:hypothetical protein
MEGVEVVVIDVIIRLRVVVLGVEVVVTNVIVNLHVIVCMNER